jgi:hypothetical protein
MHTPDNMKACFLFFRLQKPELLLANVPTNEPREKQDQCERQETKIVRKDTPEGNKGGLFFGKLPNPELPLAKDPAREPLENSSRHSGPSSWAATCLCFEEGEGLKKKK